MSAGGGRPGCGRSPRRRRRNCLPCVLVSAYKPGGGAPATARGTAGSALPPGPFRTDIPAGVLGARAWRRHDAAVTAVQLGIELSPNACRIVEVDRGVPWRQAQGDSRVRSFTVLPPSGPETQAKLASLRRRSAAV